MLVTGAAGFIGSNFVQFWVEHHAADKIIGLDALTYAGNMARLEPGAEHERFTFVKGDIRDGDAVRDIIKRKASTPSCISPRNPTSIARSTVRILSSTPTSGEPTSC